MAQALVKNNAYSTLAADLTSSATSLTVATGQGSRFPVVADGNFFFATLVDSANNLEIVKVVATATDVFTINRGQDGTSGLAYVIGDRIELRPTAALFNDKLSVGGGATTGPITVPASATGSQVPRVSEVVKKSGDTMTGALILPELRGSSNEIAVPATHRIRGASAGSLVAPGMVIQTVYKRSDTRVAYSATAPGTVSGTPGNAVIAELTQTFTPIYANSKVLLHYNIFGEASNDNAVFLIARGGTVIARNTNSTDIYSGLAVLPFDGNATTTPATQHIMYMDTPGSTSTVEYTLLFQPATTSLAISYYLNRSVSSAGASGSEIGISQLVIQEIAQ
tara:strand:+ start:76 stop:1086 length:1011 start_codon:yes stop_codon:yes gene_type:complete